MENIKVICTKYDKCIWDSCDHIKIHDYCGSDCDILCLSGKCSCKPANIVQRKKKLQKINKLK